MYVRKFEGETLDEALKAVKSELGPEAIILKTNSFKGLKGSLKKKKYEVTAAISEEEYTKKAKIDTLLDDQQKESFYSSSSRNISKVINSYGNLSLNRSVNKTEAEDSRRESDDSLSNFLGEEDARVVERPQPRVQQEAPIIDHQALEQVGHLKSQNSELRNQLSSQNVELDKIRTEMRDMLEQFNEFRRLNSPETKAGELKNILRSFDLSENLILNVLRKANFELNSDEMEDEELLYDITFREIKEVIKVAPALFTQTEFSNSGVVTILLGEGATGQTSMGLKMAGLVSNSIILTYDTEENAEKQSLANSILGIKTENCKNLQELTSKLRENIDLGKKVFIDLNCCNHKQDHTKKITQSLRSSFKNVEILLSLSAIHSELYNKRVCNKYADIIDGLVVSHLDQCLNLSSLINLQYETSKPYIFFGNGRVVPKDIEEASADRLISEIFNVRD